MRLLITTGIFPPDIGGPATQIEQLASDLAKNGFSVSVLTYGAPEKKARNFKLFSVSRAWPKFLRQLVFGIKTFFLARRNDVIYTTDLYSPGRYSMLAARLWRKKFVVRFAGDSAWEKAFNSGLIKDNILLFQEKRYSEKIEEWKRKRAEILKSADAVVAVSGFMKELAIEIGCEPEKVKIIYNAVDFAGPFPAAQEPARPTLVFSGRLTPWKGVSMLIRVVARLKQKYPDIVFEILGIGSEILNLKALTQEFGIEKNINFHGQVSEQETHQIFSRSTIFVLNTNYEGLSHAILHAMAVGIPVITTPVGGNPELIRDGEDGLLAPYNNEEEWFSAIDKLLQDKDLREKFTGKSKEVLEKFKWSELLEKTVEVFNDLFPPLEKEG